MNHEIHNKNGIRRSLDLYSELTSDWDYLRDLTKAMYGLLEEAVEECGLNEMERRVMAHRYVSPKDSQSPLTACADFLGVSNRTVDYYSATLLDKVHEYMEQEGGDYYSQHNIRFQN